MAYSMQVMASKSRFTSNTLGVKGMDTTRVNTSEENSGIRSEVRGTI
jgi:hypothetical protein